MKAVVLLVEDERDTRELLSLAVERAGYTCLPVANGEAALEAAAGAFIDVVVTDVALGEDDRAGLRLIAALRVAGVRAPVIVITAFADLEKVKFALNEGAAHLLEKPFRAHELLAAIERVRGVGTDVAHAVDQVLSRAQLTGKELAVAKLLFDGLSSSEIAELERNSPKTIRQHVSRIYAKCGVGSRAEFFKLLYAR